MGYDKSKPYRLLPVGLPKMSDPRTLLRQLQLQTQAARYAQTLREANLRIIKQVVRKG